MTTPLPPATCHHFNSPVYVVNLLTWQVGHLLIDILEPLFNMIINDHPNNKNATANHIFIQVAHPAENAILQHLIARDLYTDSVDSPFSLLTKLSDNVVKPFAALDSDFECVTFEEINLEVDVCNTYYSVGHDKNIANDELVENYARLRHLHSHLQLTYPSTPIKIQTVSLESMTFQSQIQLFRSTDLLIGSYGSAIHNVLFLRETAQVLLLLQPGWCDYAWPYAFQAEVCGVGARVLCSNENEEEEKAFRWTNRAWEFGPWRTKDSNFIVDEREFISAVDVWLTRRDDWSKQEQELEPELEQVHPPTMLQPHVSDLRITPDLTSPHLARVMLVVEILILGSLSPSIIDSLASDTTKLCLKINDFDDDGGPTCVSSRDFNEFSTLDLLVPFGVTVGLEVFLTGAGASSSSTFFFITPGRSTDGLKFSTITHVKDTPVETSEDGVRDYIVDWQHFQKKENKKFSLFTFPIANEFEFEFEANLSKPTEFQRKLSELFALCEGKYGRGRAYQLASEVFYSAIRYQNELLNVPHIQKLPNASNPFVFLHHEKTAGSSLRRYITQAAVKNNLAFYVPCFDGEGKYWEDIRCYGFDLSNATVENGNGNRNGLEVIGGHFMWNVWQNEIETEQEIDPACFVMFRDPVERAVSLYYERVYPREDIGQTMMNDWTIEEFKWLLTNFKSSAWGIYRDEGMCNTLCMMLLERNHHKGRTPAQVQVQKQAQTFSPADIELAKSRVDKCVVGLQDSWQETKRLLFHFYPWLTFVDDVMANTGMKKAETTSNLKEELRIALEECNTCDGEVFEYAKERFWQLVDHVDLVERNTEFN